MHLSLTSPTFYVTVCFYAVAVYNCAKVIGSRTSPGAAAAWILVNLTMPYVGVPLYLLLGDFRIKGYVRRHRAGSKELDDEGHLEPPTLPPDADELPEGVRATYSSFRAAFSKFGPVFEPQRGSAALLVDGKQTFEAIFAAIASAERYIVVQYYIVRHDRLGLELKRLLIEKAKAGVHVYMLYDDLGSWWLRAEYIRDLRRSGVLVERFLPIASFKRFFQMNFRNHRKLVTVDGRTAFTGGLNVGEEYAARRSKKAHRRYWRDTHVRVTGGAVAQLEDIFFEDWYFATGEKIDLQAQLAASKTQQAAESVDSGPSDTALQIIPTGPTDGPLISILFVLHLINSATKRLWIASPYFVPDPAIMRALELAALRGVDVRLVIPRQSDNRIVQWVSLSYAGELMARGVKVLLYTSGFMHQKVILVDEALAAVGTMNMDNRAMYLNFETMVLVHGEAFNAETAKMLEQDFLACRYPSLGGSRFTRSLRRMRGNVARLGAPLL